MNSTSEEVKCSPNTLSPLRLIGVVVALLGLYLSTASMELAVHRHMTDGSLQWLRDRPGVRTAVDLYCLPATWLARVGPIRWTLEIMSDFWCRVLAAPETT